MKLSAIVIGLALLLSSCGPSQAKMQEYLAQTLTAMPTATFTPTVANTQQPTNTLQPTKVPLKDIPIKDILKDNTDYIPTGFTLGQFRNEAPEMLWGIKKPVNVITAAFARKGDMSGFITIFVYQNGFDADQAYKYIYDGFGNLAEEHMLNFGKLGSAIIDMTVAGTTFQSVDAVLQKCNVVYMVRTPDTNYPIPAFEYLEQLSKAVNPYVCK